jgi:uncharacterized membrane protein
VSTQSRAIALVTYLLPLAGPLGALAARRHDALVRYHALQALAIDLGALAAPLIWAALGWVLAWVPTAGPLLGLASFGLVLAVEALLFVGRLLGVFWALRGELRAAPVVGGWAERLAFTAEPPPAPAAPEPAVERLNVER